MCIVVPVCTLYLQILYAVTNAVARMLLLCISVCVTSIYLFSLSLPPNAIGVIAHKNMWFFGFT